MDKYAKEPNNGLQNDVSEKEENQFLIENVRKIFRFSRFFWRTTNSGMTSGVIFIDNIINYRYIISCSRGCKIRPHNFFYRSNPTFDNRGF